MGRNVTFFNKVFISVLLMMSLIFNNIICYAVEPPSPDSIGADGAVLMDAFTGEILWSKNMHEPYAPASTTKVMTALLVIENCDLDEYVTVNASAVGTEGSKIWILENEQFTVRDLLYALMISSANDVAVALAEHVSGSVEAFCSLMNEKAKELGAENTNFVNPHGLYDDNHRTTAYDLALIMREAMKHPEFEEFAGALSHKIPATSQAEERQLWSQNKIIAGAYNYEGFSVDASKTGYTVQSLSSFVAGASKDNHRLIVSLLHDGKPSYYKDTLNLFEYGFENFKLTKRYAKGDHVTNTTIGNTEIPLLSGEDVYYVDKVGSTNAPTPKTKVELTKEFHNVGDVVGEATLTTPLSDISFPLLIGVEYGDEKKTNVLSPNSKTPSYTPFIINIIVIILLIVFVRIYQIKKKNKRRKRRFGN